MVSRTFGRRVALGAGTMTQTLASTCQKITSRHFSRQRRLHGATPRSGTAIEETCRGMCLCHACPLSTVDSRSYCSQCCLCLMKACQDGAPKTTKLGGLPNYTFEPRKPVPLGTMFRNGVECISGCISFQDIVMLPEHQQEKDYFGEESVLPDKSKIKSHTAEVIRQVEGAGVLPQPPRSCTGSKSIQLGSSRTMCRCTQGIRSTPFCLHVIRSLWVTGSSLPQKSVVSS